jgi:aryl-alcohol dehydrogenase-like predicted oxidoreductase
VDLPSYWFPRPPSSPDDKTQAGFAALLAAAVSQGPDKPISYTLPAPKWQFLCYVAEQAGYALHGSNNPSIERFDPRRSYDSDAFGFTTGLTANLQLADALRPIAERRDAGVAEVAIAWALAWPGLTGAIVGARKPAQVDGWIRAASMELTPADLDEIAGVITRSGAGAGPARP